LVRQTANQVIRDDLVSSEKLQEPTLVGVTKDRAQRFDLCRVELVPEDHVPPSALKKRLVVIRNEIDELLQFLVVER
jgi:hypothetical protein